MQTPTPPHTVDALLRVIEVRDAEVVLLKLMIDKLKLQLLRRLRAEFGSSSEQLDAGQIALIASEPLDEHPAPRPSASAAAANAPEVDRSLPAHLPREQRVLRPETSAAHHDAAGQACGKIRQLTCAPLLAETFKRISKGDSVISLFID